jgi:hypothetical protein
MKAISIKELKIGDFVINVAKVKYITEYEKMVIIEFDIDAITPNIKDPPLRLAYRKTDYIVIKL